MEQEGIEVRLEMVREKTKTLTEEIATALVMSEYDWREVGKMLKRVLSILESTFPNPIVEGIIETCARRAEMQRVALNRVIAMMCGKEEGRDKDGQQGG